MYIDLYCIISYLLNNRIIIEITFHELHFYIKYQRMKIGKIRNKIHFVYNLQRQKDTNQMLTTTTGTPPHIHTVRHQTDYRGISRQQNPRDRGPNPDTAIPRLHTQTITKTSTLVLRTMVLTKPTTAKTI